MKIICEFKNHNFVDLKMFENKRYSILFLTKRFVINYFTRFFRGFQYLNVLKVYGRLGLSGEPSESEN